MSSGKIAIPATLKSSSLSNLSKTAMTRSVNVAAEVLYVDPEECYVVVNPRKTFNEELIESYTAEFLDPAQGQREPCHVYPKDDKGYRIHHGATRRLAALKAKLLKPDFKLKVIVGHELPNRSDAVNFFEQGANNIKRDNMSVFDQADWIATSIAMAEAEGTKLTLTEVAKMLAMSKTKVSRIYALRDAATEIREVYETKTQDPETLTNLVKIRETNPELFTLLIENTDLDRATVRDAAKTGQLAETPEAVSQADNNVQLNNTESNTGSEPSEETEGSNASVTFNVKEFVAHAQQNVLEDLELSTGKVTIYTGEVKGGYAAAATTDFPDNHIMTLDQNRFKVWDDAETALNQAYLDLCVWSEKLEKQTTLNEEQKKDVELLSGFLRMRLVLTPESPELSPKKEPKTKSKSKASFIHGSWKGEDCTLITDLSLLTEDQIEALGSSDMVYIDCVKSGRKMIQPEEFTLKCLKF